MIKDDGWVYRESTDYKDLVDTYIPLDWMSSWIKMSSLQGFQRVIWLSLIGEVYTEGITINYEIFYNYIDENPQTGSILVDAGFMAVPPAQFRIKPRFGNGRSQAFKIRLYDSAPATPAGSQEGYAISEIMVQIGRLPGIMRQGTLKTK